MAQRKRKSKEELTTKMHSELSVSPEDDRKLTVFTCLSAIEAGIMNKRQVLELYGITDEELEKHTDEWSEFK